MIRFFIAFVLAAGSVLGGAVNIAFAASSEEQAANRLFVVAVQLMQQAEKIQDPEDKLQSFTQALEHLREIIRSYSGSSLAVQLVSGQRIGVYSLSDAEDQVSQLSQAVDSRRRMIAAFNHAKELERLKSTNSCTNCDLAYLTWHGAHLPGANLRGADLRWADLRGANLSKADLRNANLEGAKLWAGTFSGADVRGANLTDANFNNTFLINAQTDGAKFCRTVMSNGSINNSGC